MQHFDSGSWSAADFRSAGKMPSTRREIEKEYRRNRVQQLSWRVAQGWVDRARLDDTRPPHPLLRKARRISQWRPVRRTGPRVSERIHRRVTRHVQCHEIRDEETIAIAVRFDRTTIREGAGVNAARACGARKPSPS